VHRAGQRARAVLEEARRSIADAVGAHPADVVLTSGGTEAVNLAVCGLGAGAEPLERVVTTGLAHPALFEAAAHLEARGATRVILEVPGGQAPDDAVVEALLGPGVLLAVGWVNHETGTVLPVARWAKLAERTGARMAVDASQALGKLPIDVVALGATTVALASSKMGGPSGAGAVVVARDAKLAPTLHGGRQERGRRPGSPNVAAVVGFGAACRALPARLAAMAEVGARRDALEAHLVALGAVINGVEAPRVPTVTNASFRGLRGDALVAALDVEGLCASSGAACSSGVAEASTVVTAMYPDAPWRARATLRLSLGPETSDDDVTSACAALTTVLKRFE
jgi:cysteine desulfurase